MLRLPTVPAFQTVAHQEPGDRPHTRHRVRDNDLDPIDGSRGSLALARLWQQQSCGQRSTRVILANAGGLMCLVRVASVAVGRFRGDTRRPIVHSGQSGPAGTQVQIRDLAAGRPVHSVQALGSQQRSEKVLSATDWPSERVPRLGDCGSSAE